MDVRFRDTVVLKHPQIIQAMDVMAECLKQATFLYATTVEPSTYVISFSFGHIVVGSTTHESTFQPHTAEYLTDTLTEHLTRNSLRSNHILDVSHTVGNGDEYHVLTGIEDANVHHKYVASQSVQRYFTFTNNQAISCDTYQHTRKDSFHNYVIKVLVQRLASLQSSMNDPCLMEPIKSTITFRKEYEV